MDIGVPFFPSVCAAFFAFDSEMQTNPPRRPSVFARSITHHRCIELPDECLCCRNTANKPRFYKAVNKILIFHTANSNMPLQLNDFFGSLQKFYKLGFLS